MNNMSVNIATQRLFAAEEEEVWGLGFKILVFEDLGVRVFRVSG